MSVIIGHASISEKGTINGVKGDQNGKEVVTRTWYNKPWIAVYRPKNRNVAEKLAKTCEEACANNYIGYGQNDRLSLYAEASRVGFKMGDVTAPCNADCSSLVAVCCIAAGVPVSPSMYTAIEDKSLTNTGMFDKFTTTLYTRHEDFLKRGDILLAQGHTAIVLTNGVKSNKIYATNYDTNLASSYIATTDVYMRGGAGRKYPAYTVIKKGTSVYCYGYYTPSNNVKWLYVQMYKNGAVYTGFVSERYLQRGV